MKPKGVTFIDVIIGTSLMLIVFLGIFAAYQLNLKIVGISKTRIDATALANQWIEIIRNLPYESVGTVGASLPYAEGILDSSTSTVRNGIEYTVEISVRYISEETYGTGEDDDCDLDYKRAEVKVSWAGRFSDQISFVSDISPKDLNQEIQTCEGQLVGTLSVRVFDAYGVMIEFPSIKIFNPTSSEEIFSVISDDGKEIIPLASSTYKVVVSKDGYSSERTYGTEEVATPENPHPIVFEGQTTEISFSIDKLSAFSVDTLSPWGIDYFTDSFLDETKISGRFNVTLSDGEMKLATDTEGYVSPGYATSTEVSPGDLISWEEFIFTDFRPPGTDLKHQIYYASGTDWFLIPDTILPGNSAGFDSSPVDLSSLDIATYSQLKMRANFSTTLTSNTPTLYDWQVSWISSEATPISNVTFNLRGAKLIGYDGGGNPVYKYSENHISNSQGHIDIPDLEWDSYTFAIDPATGLDLVGTDPEPQPITLPPDTNSVVKLYSEAENSLLITVQDMETLDPMPAASVKLSNDGLGYDTTQYTNEEGQTYFIPLQPSSYDLEVEVSGYSTVLTVVSVSGDETETIKIQEIE